jgi:uncharacterized protein
MRGFFASRKGIIITGIAIGIIAPALQFLGNPGNMGICVACFERDIAGALGLHRAAVVQYLRPEIIGVLLGAMAVAFVGREFRARGGSSPLIRFFLGVFAMVGALVFLGCPWRALLRLAGGDWNAVLGLAGLAGGIYVGSLFLKRGYTLHRSHVFPGKASGLVMPALMVGLLLLLVFGVSFGEGNPIFFSTTGPGASRAPLFISLAAGLAFGALAQRSRFCTMGSLRDIFISRDLHLFYGVAALVLTAFTVNLVLGQFSSGFEGQPIAHSMHIWNFLGMVLAGLAFCLAGGCPGRQLILAGEGDTDAGVFVMGMLVGAGFAHNFAMASSPAGVGSFGPSGVVVGLAFCLTIGWFMTETRKRAA